MRVDKKISEELGFVLTVDALVKAYQEIAVLKMQRVRGTVLSAREFLDLLDEVFSDVKGSYASEIANIEKNKKLKGPKTARRAGIFLSANSRFYGDIIKRVFRTFLEDYKKTYDEMIVMGKVGRELIEEQNKNIKFSYIEYNDVNISKDLIMSFTESLKGFDTVQIYYGKFENVVNQEPARSVVKGEEEKTADTKKKVGFFFEPSLAKILSYFENQVISSFLLQSIHESDLAKLASRTRAMEEAHQRIGDKKTSLFGNAKRAKRLVDDKKQQERLAGMYLWKQ